MRDKFDHQTGTLLPQHSLGAFQRLKFATLDVDLDEARILDPLVLCVGIERDRLDRIGTVFVVHHPVHGAEIFTLAVFVFEEIRKARLKK